MMEELKYIQAELKAPKNLFNSYGGYNYRNLEGILESVKPLLIKYKCQLTISDEMVAVADRVYVKATVTLKNSAGETETVTAYAREAETKKGMDDSQITGTASSYARKYACNGLFLIDDTKDADTNEYHKQDKAMAEEKPDKISAAKVKAVVATLQRNGIDPAYVCACFKIRNIKDLTEEQHSNVIDHLDDVKRKYEEWKAKQG